MRVTSSIVYQSHIAFFIPLSAADLVSLLRLEEQIAHRVALVCSVTFVFANASGKKDSFFHLDQSAQIIGQSNGLRSR